ncbi:MAG: hypothetical protein IKL89_06485 [Clostridia bacterium]|nr:hypothetical protein [Clostridia bacterium]
MDKRSQKYRRMYARIFRILGDLTPLRADCGQLCGAACCKGDAQTGMRLFPHEESVLSVTETPDGGRLCVCDGSCDRKSRPLACRIFPFFPTVDDRGRIFVEPDMRAARLCPLIANADEILFDRRFFRALRRVGKILSRDPECRAYLREVTEEIDTFAAFLG